MKQLGINFINEAFDLNHVFPLGPNLIGFEDDIKAFSGSPHRQTHPRHWQSPLPDVHDRLWRRYLFNHPLPLNPPRKHLCRPPQPPVSNLSQRMRNFPCKSFNRLHRSPTAHQPPYHRPGRASGFGLSVGGFGWNHGSIGGGILLFKR